MVRGCMNKIKLIGRENSFLVRPFIVAFGLYLVGASAIILAGVHFADDVARTNFGYSGWAGFSRYFSTIAAFGLHADGYLANIYPLPQILALVILAAASVLLICVIAGKEIFRERWVRWIWSLFAVLPAGLSPYMLECLAYQYDAPYMAVSVLAAILPLVFSQKSWFVYGLAMFSCVIVICTSYQVAIGVIPMLVVFVAAKKWNEGGRSAKRSGVKFVGFSAIVFFVALLFFQKVLMRPREAYVSNSLPELQYLMPKFLEHLGQYFQLVLTDLKIWWLVIIGVICGLFVVRFIMRSKRNKIVAGTVALCVIAFVFVMAFAFYAVLDKPLYATRAMYPFGVALAVVGVYVVDGAGWVIRCARVATTVLTWCFVVFALTFGNVLSEQDDYRHMLENMVIADLNQLPVMLDSTPKYIQVSGNLGFSPVIWHMPDNYNILRRLLMPSYSEYVPWMATKITEQSGMPNLVFDETRNLEEMNLPLVKETVFYDILGDGENILIRFKDARRFEVLF